MVAAVVCLYAKVPKGFFPQQDTGARQRLDPGRPGHVLPGHAEEARPVHGHGDATIPPSRAPTVSSAAGTANRPHVRGPEAARERDVTADQVIARLRGKLTQRAGRDPVPQPVQDVRVGGRLGGAQYQYTLQARRRAAELFAWAPRDARGSAEAPRAHRRQQRPAGPRACRSALVIDRETASAPGRHARRRSTPPSTTPSDSARSRRCTRRSTSTTS